MRLLIYASEFPPGPGGIGEHAYQVARHLARRGWRICVAAPQHEASEAAIRAFNRRQPFAVRRLPRTVTPLALRGADHVLASGQRAVWMAALSGRPFTAVAHGREFHLPGLALTRRAFRRARSVLAVSDFTRREMRAAGIDQPRVHVVRNGADAERFFPQQVERAPGRLLLTVGSVTARKGQAQVVRALPHLPPDVTYHMAGPPREGERITALAHALGVADRIVLHGVVPRAELPGLVNACDLFVLASQRTPDDVEGFGIAVLEAALCRKPAVVTAGSGLEEAVQHGVTGLVVPPGDPAALAAAIRDLLADDERRLSMGEAARMAARTWDQVVDEVAAVLAADMR